MTSGGKLCEDSVLDPQTFLASERMKQSSWQCQEATGENTHDRYFLLFLRC